MMLQTWRNSACIFFVELLLCGVVLGDVPTVRVGVYCESDKARCLKRWKPLVHQLNGSISGYHFQLIPLAFDEALPAIAAYEIDLLIANPTLYVYASVDADQPVRIMATLAREYPVGVTSPERGGVLFALRSGTQALRLEDLRGRRLAAVNAHSFGGWISVWSELDKVGVEPARYFKEVQFVGQAEGVVEAVLSGKAAAGVVPCGVLETLASQGGLDLKQVHIHWFVQDAAPFLCSTPLYPEWVLSRLTGVSDGLAKDILEALWSEPVDSGAAVEGVRGWMLPLDYHSVRVAMRELRIGPYESYMRRMTPLDRLFWVWYWRWILASGMALAGLLLVVVIILRLNRRLVVARNNAESADQAKSEFLANMSHEIRTPLNAVLGLSDLMMTTTLTDQQSDYVKTIYSSSEALFAIINNILDISKIDAGKLELENAEFDVRHCVESSLEVVAAGAQSKGLVMICEIDPALPPRAVGDFSRLRQVLLNLLSNAVKFTEKGQVLIRASAEPVDGDRHQLIIEIEDSGIGLTQEQIERIFAPFSQADSSTTRKYGGTGLGLSISRRILELMGGEIEVQSEVGVGSTFAVKIPVEMGGVAEAAFLTRQHECLAARTVLLVDPHGVRGPKLKEQLEYWGMLVTWVDNARDAMNWVDSGSRYDLIIMDSVLAEQCGVERCEQFKRAAAYYKTAVVLMVFKDVVHSGLFDSIINKPVMAGALFDRMTGLLCASGGKCCVSGEKYPPVAAADGEALPVDLSIRILVVDDVRVNLKVAQRMCERLGYSRVDSVSNGREALVAVAENKYDVVLMDVQMPEMDGLQATRCICSRFPPAKRPVVVGMTANAMLEDRTACYEAGMSDYISKPVHNRKLAEALAKIRRRI